jgi:hypothetical protein
MELTFMHKSLGYYKDSPAGKALEDIYGKQITQVYVPSKNQDFTPSFEAMQKILTRHEGRPGYSSCVSSWLRTRKRRV